MALMNKTTFQVCHFVAMPCYKPEDWCEIDEQIAMVISELNKKGYRTNFCCSGHALGTLSKFTVPQSSIDHMMRFGGKIYHVKKSDEPQVFDYLGSNDECYIAFAARHEFKKLPPDFKIEIEEPAAVYAMRLAKEYKSQNHLLLAEEILITMQQLWAWVQELEPINRKESSE